MQFSMATGWSVAFGLLLRSSVFAEDLQVTGSNGLNYCFAIA
jgi:hypothetical protein